MSATGAYQKIALGGPDFHAMTSRTYDALGPSEPYEILTACLLRTEEHVELSRGFRVIIHARILPIGVTGVKGIPP